MVKKIAFEGAICTGKTTIFEHYQRMLSEDSKAAFINEAGREYLQAHPRVDYQASLGVSERIQSLALTKEKAAHKSGATMIICDRSVLSAVVYERANGNKRESDRLLKRVRSWLPSYTSLLLFDPKDIPYTYDEIRRGDGDQRQRYHALFQSIFTELQIPCQIISGTVEERIKIIDAILIEKY